MTSKSFSLLKGKNHANILILVFLIAWPEPRDFFKYSSDAAFSKYGELSGSQSTPLIPTSVHSINSISHTTSSDPNKSMFSSTLSRTPRREGKRMLLDFFDKQIYTQCEVVAMFPPFNYLMVVERDVFLVLKSFHTIGG